MTVRVLRSSAHSRARLVSPGGRVFKREKFIFNRIERASAEIYSRLKRHFHGTLDAAPVDCSYNVFARIGRAFPDPSGTSAACGPTDIS